MSFARSTACGLVVIVMMNIVGCASMDSTQGDPGDVDASAPLLTDGPFNLRVPKNHIEIIERNSAGDSQFAGLYAAFEVKATLLNSDVREALIQRQTGFYLWDNAQQMAERAKALQELNTETEAFISFATPERKNDNLADKKSSIWRVFLDAGGRRYVGQIKKDRRLTAEIQAQYPYHTRWNTPYILTFPVSTTSIEMNPVKLTLTGPLGSRVLEFKPVGHQQQMPTAAVTTMSAEPEPPSESSAP